MTGAVYSSTDVQRTLFLLFSMLHFFVIGVSHQKTPLPIREALSKRIPALPSVLQILGGSQIVSEVVVLSTCNRIEWYIRASSPDALLTWLRTQSDILWENIKGGLYVYQDQQAVEHLFSVACGIQSIMIGETEIVHQIKQAAHVAQEAGYCGAFLKKVFQSALETAKLVRTHTDISKHAVSIPSIVCQLLKHENAEKKPLRILCIGAGQIIQRCLTHFLSADLAIELTIINRSLTHAQTLTSRFGGQAFSLSKLTPSLLQCHDIVITAIHCSTPIITEMMLTQCYQQNRTPRVWIDLGVPRNIAQIDHYPDEITYYSVDTLSQIIAGHQLQRQQAADCAQTFIIQQAADFIQSWKARAHIPLIQALQAHAQSLSNAEIARAKKALQNGENPETVLQRFSRALTNKLLHSPLRVLAETAGDDTLVAHIARMYHLTHHSTRTETAMMPSLHQQDTHEKHTKN